MDAKLSVEIINILFILLFFDKMVEKRINI